MPPRDTDTTDTPGRWLGSKTRPDASAQGRGWQAGPQLGQVQAWIYEDPRRGRVAMIYDTEAGGYYVGPGGDHWLDVSTPEALSRHLWAAQTHRAAQAARQRRRRQIHEIRQSLTWTPIPEIIRRRQARERVAAWWKEVRRSASATIVPTRYTQAPSVKDL